jgi:hypothetical protein
MGYTADHRVLRHKWSTQQLFQWTKQTTETQASIVLIWGKPFIFCYVYQSTVHKIKLTCHYYTVRSTHTSQGYNQQNRSLFVYIPVQNNYPHFYLKQQAKLDESTNQWTRLQTKKQYLHIQSIVFPWNNMPLLQKLQCKSNTPSIFINCLSFTRDFWRI